MKIFKRIVCCLLISLCLFSFTACGQKQMSFKVVSELNHEEFRVGFRQDDPLADIVIAALQELAFEGQLSRLSIQYLGADYSCMEGEPEALLTAGEVEPGRVIRVGVQDGIAPICSVKEDGTYVGLIPDLVNLVADKLGWKIVFMTVDSETIAAHLGSGNVDCAWMAASLEDAENTTVSPGWLKNSHDLVVRSGSGYNTKNSLKGHIIGITDSTCMDALVSAEMDDKIANVWYYDDVATCFNALASGDCEAIIIDDILSSYYM